MRFFASLFNTALFTSLFSALMLLASSPGMAQSAAVTAACESLLDLRSLTITRASIRKNTQDDSSYCYVRGIISPAIHFHAQLPMSVAFFSAVFCSMATNTSQRRVSMPTP